MDEFRRGNRDELKEWTVDLDLTFKARGLGGAIAVSHAFAEWLQEREGVTKVTLGENYREGEE